MSQMVVFYNASSASPSFVSAGLNPDRSLEARTELVELWGAPGQEGMAVYRWSNKAPGYLSADVYTMNTGAWEFVGEHDAKYSQAPFPPAGSV